MHRIDRISRRAAVAGGFVAAVAAALGIRPAGAATCPEGQVYRAGVGCICRSTGRPPVDGACYSPRAEAGAAVVCPEGQIYRRGVGCICRSTGRPPVDGVCA